MATRKEALLLAGVAVLGAGLRLYDLGGKSLWYDEGITVTRVRLSAGELCADAAEGLNAPLYYLLLHPLAGVLGASEAAIRLPSVVFSVAAIVMVHRVGQLLFSRRVALLAALLMALSAFHVYYAQEARTYALLSLLTLASMELFLRLFASRSWALSLGYVAATAALMYTHAYAFTTLAAQNAIFLSVTLAHRRPGQVSIRRWLLLQGLVAALYAPWMATVLRQASQAHALSWLLIPRSPWLMPAYTLGVYAGYSAPLLVLLLALAVTSLMRWEKQRGELEPRDLFASLEGHRWSVSLADVRSHVVVLVWLGTPLLVPIAASLVARPVYLYRCTIGASAAFFLLAANGLARLRSRPMRWIVLAAIVALSAAPLKRYYLECDKEPWREVTRQVEAHAQPSDLVLFNHPRCRATVFAFYARRSDLVLAGFPSGSPNVRDEDLGQLDALVADHPRVWLILSHAGDGADRLVTALGERYDARQRQQYAVRPLSGRERTAITVSLFERRPAP